MAVPTQPNSTSPQGRSARPLAVVVVTYNSADTLGGLLDTMAIGLEGIEQWEIVVADNASSDRSSELAEGHPIGARVVRTGRNGGYSAGINAAIATVRDDADVLILNSDIRLSRGSVRRLVEPFGSNTVAVAVPRILHEDGSLYLSLRREPSVITAWADALLGSKLGSGLDLGECVCAPRHYDAPGAVDWASGAALAVSAEARAAIGSWDESFFLYSEEVDYQRRARRAGFTIAYVPQAEIVHFGGDYNANPRLYSILTTNRILDYARHHGAVATALFRLAVLTGEALRSLGGSTVHQAGVKAAMSFDPREPPIGTRMRQEARNA